MSENITTATMLKMQRVRMVLLRIFDLSSILRYSPTRPNRSKNANCDTCLSSFSVFLEISS